MAKATDKSKAKVDEADGILATRKHAILAARMDQMELNWLCYKAGKPYIRRRLHRNIHEDDLSWNGIEDAENKVSVPPRVERTHFVPYASRIVDKIEEHVFGKPIKRDGGDEFFLKNTDRRGADVNGVMKLLYEYWTVCGWGWLGVDRVSSTGTPSKSVAEKERNRGGVCWTAYAPWEVVDWCYEKSGGLKWVLTEKAYYDNEDPFAEPTVKTARTLWLPGGGRRIWTGLDGKPFKTDEFTISHRGVPFRLLGETSSEPHWFDSVEMIAASLLNLESEAHANLSKGVYSIPVVPSELANGASSGGLGRGKETVEATEGKVLIQKVYGRKNPIYEDEASKGVTRFVTPAQGDMNAFPSEIERTKKALYEIAGLGVSKQKDTADAESADAKQFDHLDINAVLRDMSQAIQVAEENAIEISTSFDNTFKPYKPVYPTEFSVIDFSSMMNGVERLDAIGVDLPKTLRVAIVRALAEGIPNVSEDERKNIEAEVKEMLDENDDAIRRVATAAHVAGTGVDGAEVVADTALNGAQVASLVSVIQAVVAGQMPTDTAKAAISAAFPALDEKAIADIVNPLSGFKPQAPVEPAATQ